MTTAAYDWTANSTFPCTSIIVLSEPHFLKASSGAQSAHLLEPGARQNKQGKPTCVDHHPTERQRSIITIACNEKKIFFFNRHARIIESARRSRKILACPGVLRIADYRDSRRHMPARAHVRLGEVSYNIAAREKNGFPRLLLEILSLCCSALSARDHCRHARIYGVLA